MKRILSVVLCLILVFMIIPMNEVSAGVVPTITVSKAIANRGENVKVSISIVNNPGIMAMDFCITYDITALEYVGYEEGYLSNYNIKDHNNKGLLYFVNIEDTERNENGTMLTFLFKVKDNAELGSYEFCIVNNNPEKHGESLHNSFSDAEENFIVPIVDNGSVKIIDINPQKGDVNGDGNVNGRDYAVLIQFINNWNVEIVKEAADVNNDGKINGRDYAMLMQYLNGWGIEFK